MGIEEFFGAIRDRCSSDDEYAVELLKARGFLLEDNELALSDNSHPDDEDYLNMVLQKEHLGGVKNGKITLIPNGKMEKIFSKEHVGGMEGFCDRAGWQLFVQNSYAPKVPVSILEPFIARYVKAISACGVKTSSSCDGNHPERRRTAMHVQPCDEANVLWHDIIYKRCVYPFFNLRWREQNCYFIEIRVTETDKWETYVKVNRVAEFLYANRLVLRQVRQDATEVISNSMANHMTNNALSEIFRDRANELLDKCWLTVNMRMVRSRKDRKPNQNT